MARVTGLGHVGIYVRDLDRMTAFYRDNLGMQVTKQNMGWGAVFLSADPAESDHQIALMSGRPDNGDPHLINQISMSVATLDDLRTIYHRIVDAGLEIREVVSHVSAVGCYFSDPEGNRTEVYWLTGKTSWAVIAEPVDLDQPDEVILDVVERGYARTRVIPMGGRTEQYLAPAGSHEGQAQARASRRSRGPGAAVVCGRGEAGRRPGTGAPAARGRDDES
jgi:catechol-2,3-dioxygenase